MNLHAAKRPTMYFIGVSTARSIIMRVFPAWARHLRFGECELQGIDLALHDRPERYREVVKFIKDDPLSIGALVTTHKIDLLHATRDMFDGLDDFASLMGEVSSISKKDGRLLGAAKDPISSGLALDAFLPREHWHRSGADAFIMGAGGSSIALCSYLLKGGAGGGTAGTAVRFQPQPGQARRDAEDPRHGGHRFSDRLCPYTPSRRQRRDHETAVYRFPRGQRHGTGQGRARLADHR